jgi:enoyl-CoA hydratase/3-hydroxyacyl-CoA dehydrogenase
MKIELVKTIAVLGAGTMGHGIAELAALAGYRVHLYDINEEFAQKGLQQIKWSLDKLVEKGRLSANQSQNAISQIATFTNLEKTVNTADFVIEAAPEKLKLKHEIFATIEKAAPAHAVLATNTSSLPITEIAAIANEPGRVVGMHFFNPPMLMPLVEVIKGQQTSDASVELTVALSKKFGKTPVVCRKDTRGFITSAMFEGFVGEPMWIASRQKVNIKNIDAVMKYKEGFPMGPFELADLMGLDIGYNVRKEAGFPNPPVLEEKVRSGHLGRKTKRGFYDYASVGVDYGPDDAKDFDPLPIYAMMTNIGARLVEQGVAPPADIDLAMQLGGGFPKGPMTKADEIGLDKILQALDAMHAANKEERYEAPKILRELVAAGKLGVASGEGFYKHGKEAKEYKAIKIEIEKDSKIAWLILNRPGRLNAINNDTRLELPRALQELNENAEVRAIVIRGAGDRAFSVGADITEFGAEVRPHIVVELGEFFSAPQRCNKPIIAAMDGFCLGGGLELALACDFRIATRRCELGQPEIHLGLIPGGGGTQRLTRLIGLSKAKELVMLGERISAERAFDLGLIDRITENEAFVHDVRAFAEKLAAGPPVAIRLAKQIMNAGAEAPLEAALLMEREAFGILFATEDMLEGVNSFLMKKKPEFQGK